MKSKSAGWTFFLYFLAGFIVGSAAGHYAAGISWLEWLSIGQPVGLDPPFGINFGFVSFSFGFLFHFNVGGVFGMLIAALVYKWRR
jgi:hypothetical protein